MQRFDAVIVGTGHGGAQTAIALRQQGFQGSIAMIGRDQEPPYERPPLSKEYFTKEKTFERIMIRPLAFWADKKVDLLIGFEVVAVDPEEKTVELNDGSSLGYKSLIWSAGGFARKLQCPGADLAGVYSVRDKTDVDRIMAELAAGASRAVIIGGGYIGLEAAAVLRKTGCTVTLLEALDRILARVAGEEISRFFEAQHRLKGVDLRLQAFVKCLEGKSGRVTGVQLEDGEVIACDLVIVGIGIEPAVAPLAAAGARISNGVEVDSYCRTSLPDIFAVGDCAAHANAFAGGDMIRLESVQNANDMAMTAAKTICGNGLPYAATPWFWSNQFDLKLQTVGLSGGHDESVLRGDPKSRRFSVIYKHRGQVIALDCVNSIKDYVQGRKLVESRANIDSITLSDTGVPLKELA